MPELNEASQIAIPDIGILESDCLKIDPFELDDISILDKHFHHIYPQYDSGEIKELDIGDDL